MQTSDSYYPVPCREGCWHHLKLNRRLKTCFVCSEAEAYIQLWITNATNRNIQNTCHLTFVRDGHIAVGEWNKVVAKYTAHKQQSRPASHANSIRTKNRTADGSFWEVVPWKINFPVGTSSQLNNCNEDLWMELRDISICQLHLWCNWCNCDLVCNL
jgi:hypothetical protein